MITPSSLPLYPLRFAPIFQPRIWGGRGLADWASAPLPEGPIGEAWVLSDRDDFPSIVTNGPLAGTTLAELVARSPTDMLGRLAGRFSRFPLLLKFLDLRQMLSVQVHPPAAKIELIPKGERAKTEAWLVLQADIGARAYVGLKPGVTRKQLASVSAANIDDIIPHFPLEPGQAILVEAGVVHAIGDGALVFEVQQNSDVTFRLYDWDHVDPSTGEKRALQIAEALECVDFDQGPILPTRTADIAPDNTREMLIDCDHFRVWRTRIAESRLLGHAEEPRVLVCVDGAGALEHAGVAHGMERGGVVLLPASVGTCVFIPEGAAVVLEIAARD